MPNRKHSNRENRDLHSEQKQNMSEDEQIDDDSILRDETDDASTESGERFHNPNVEKDRGMKERERENIE